MAYDYESAEMVRCALHRADLRDDESVDERRMFGGLALLVNGKMCCGVIGSDLVARVADDEADAALNEPHVRPMDFTGKPMRGWLYIARESLADDAALDRWVASGLEMARRASAEPQRMKKRTTKARGRG
jgi:TfoX/Sxy family transcriptional regulator of competence genes